MSPAMLALLPLALQGGPDAPLTLADIDAYVRALRPDDPPAEAAPASFRDLWERPDRNRGRRVRVDGRARRRFRQGATGSLPALVELWLATPSGDVLCLAFPEAAGGDPTPLGALVAFDGTFLRRIRYEGGDEPRLAPLIVGPAPPTVRRPPGASTAREPFGRVDWLVGLVVAMAVAFAILRQVLARPPRRRRPEDLGGPRPRFVDDGRPPDHEGPGPDGPAVPS